MKVERNGDPEDCRYFDMRVISDYPEREMFFCGGAGPKIVDITIYSSSNVDKVESLE